jgi:hypothetical protein
MAGNKQKGGQDIGNVPGGTGFPEAPPDANVFPPGAPQTSHGSATGPIHAETPETRPGNRQQVMGGAAAGGQPGTTAPDKEEGKKQ